MWETSEPGTGNLIRWRNCWLSSLKVIFVSRGWDWKTAWLYAAHPTTASNMDILQHRPAVPRCSLSSVSSNPCESRRAGKFLSWAFLLCAFSSSFTGMCQKKKKITVRLSDALTWWAVKEHSMLLLGLLWPFLYKVPLRHDCCQKDELLEFVS